MTRTLTPAVLAQAIMVCSAARNHYGEERLWALAVGDAPAARAAYAEQQYYATAEKARRAELAVIVGAA